MRRIYEISQDELKQEYKIYKKMLLLNDDSDLKYNNERGTFNENMIFFDGNSNDRFLNQYIKQIEVEIEKLFFGTHLNNTYSIYQYLYIPQPFKPVDCKIFISHSHKDKKVVKLFAEMLFEKFKINSFIDSKFWPYFNNVIAEYVKEVYINGNNEKLNLWDINNDVRNIIDIYLLQALQYQILNSEIIIIIKTNNYSYKSPWISFEQNLIDYICKSENCNIQHFSVRNLMNHRSL